MIKSSRDEWGHPFPSPTEEIEQDEGISEPYEIVSWAKCVYGCEHAVVVTHKPVERKKKVDRYWRSRWLVQKGGSVTIERRPA